MKYYYNCQLKATYMEKEFGMKFHTSITQGWSKRYSMDGNKDYSYDISFGGQKVDKYYIHADFINILEPRCDDLCRLNGSLNAFYVVDSHPTIGCWTLDDLRRELKNSNTQAIIIQRDGKSFHWPEVFDE